MFTLFGLRPPDRVLVVAAHPDDETLGMGGTIAALTDAGIAVDVLAVMCTSGPLHDCVSPPEVRRREFDRACTVLRVARRRLAWVDTDRAHGLTWHPADLVRLIESGEEVSLSASVPAALFLPAGGHHHDHRAVHAAALAAVRPGHRTGRPLPRLVAGYDGPEDRSWLTADAARPLVVDISDYAPAKTKALRCYTTQLRDDPHPRSLAKITALDLAAGAAIGVHAAERFALYRMVAA